ncbi:MAG: DUF2156 domain-containing protein [Clostridia bacterium]|nr:DUF2156 domain-containing protein [Clostridia bacterium]
MLDFQPLTLDCIPLVRADLSESDLRTCDYSLGGVMLWRDYLQVNYARIGTTMIYRLILPDGTEAYQVPTVPDPGLLATVYRHCRERGEPCRFAFVPPQRKDAFSAVFASVEALPQREWYDYLYRKEDLITYAGKKLRGQRNHVNKFRASYPQWDFVRGSEEDLPRLAEFYARFRDENKKTAPSWVEEERKIEEIFSHFNEYGFLCGILTVNGTVAGFSLGERRGDTLFVHTEKADRRLHGVYPMLASRFVEAFSDDSVVYVNREDDSGDEGLRAAKLSYHPCALLEKLLITVGDPF